ncbi:MAG: hypothetical protein ABS75_04635 [Pelagibacterium sp. SCN 63-23]|nr:MAG: hypothetical protein ABS75_04635 [Pelagibacterium sp. SCN 63-23]
MNIQESRDKDITNFTAAVIFAIPFAWISGLDFVAFHAAALYVLFNFKLQTKPGIFAHLLLSVAFVYVISVLVNSFFSTEPIDRYIAWANNLSVLLVGIIFFRVGKEVGFGLVTSENAEERRQSLYRSLSFVAAVYFAFSFVLKMIGLSSVSDEIRIPTLFGLVTPSLPGLLGQYRGVTLSSANWFGNGLEVRTYLFAPFATGSNLVGMLLGGLWLAFRKNISAPKFVVGFVCVALSCYFLTGARSALVSLVSALLVGGVAVVNPKLRALIFVVAITTLPIVLPAVLPFLEAVYNAREGSNDARLNTYQYTLEAVLNTNPLLGLGVRPDLDNFFIVVGSHQSFLAALTRGGLIALLLFVIAFLFALPANMMSMMESQVSQLLKSKGLWPAAVATMCLTAASLAWMLFQDIDAYPIVGTFVFLNIGIMRGLLGGALTVASNQRTTTAARVRQHASY